MDPHHTSPICPHCALPLGDQPSDSRNQCWLFNLAGWSRIDEPTTVADLDAMLHMADFGDETNGVSVSVYEHRDTPQLWVANVGGPCRIYRVLLRDLPSLLVFLGQILPTVESGMRVERMQEEFEQKCKAKCKARQQARR